MGRTIIKLGGESGGGEKPKISSKVVDEPVSTESALSIVTGEAACIVDELLLQRYLARKYPDASEGENALGMLAPPAAGRSSALDSKKIIYEEWRA
ncbi:hypothetical protein JKF63_07494 [Porcisia hertigi]|uniref:Uncharacterized protein n=1 Tax=Porcisia hertigi TaxID=2761500 RepID=A0A836ID04_9TRYP|nr:hypothetical protein JKF63_07494 [Porcisia hertigi]